MTRGFFNLSLWNARSLINKISYFQSLLYATAVDCFCVTESWLNTNINNGEVLPANYTIYRHDRDTRGGGVLIAVLDKIPSKQIVIDCELDIILVQLEVLPRILVCCVYNPPSSNDDHFNRLLDLIHSLPVHGDVLILGDFNVLDVNWDTLSASTSRSSSLCDCIFENNRIQMVTGGNPLSSKHSRSHSHKQSW